MPLLQSKKNLQSQQSVEQLIETHQSPKIKLFKSEILFNNHEVMTVGFGSSKKQADRNASIRGYNWLLENKERLQNMNRESVK